MTDIQGMSDEEFQEHRTNVQSEQERRENLARIPDQIAELKAKYVEGGGDPANLD